MSNPNKDKTPIILEVVTDEKGRLRLRDRITGRQVAFQGTALVDLHDEPGDPQVVDLEVYTGREYTQDLYERYRIEVVASRLRAAAKEMRGEEEKPKSQSYAEQVQENLLASVANALPADVDMQAKEEFTRLDCEGPSLNGGKGKSG